MDRVGIAFDFEKSAPDGSYVRGWASVVSVDGKPLADYSGHVVSMSDLRACAHDFVSNTRVAKVLHGGQPIGDVCEAVVVDDEFAKAIGATTPFRGLWIGMKVHDAEIKKRVRSGELKMFSIGGRGRLHKLGGHENLKEMVGA